MNRPIWLAEQEAARGFPFSLIEQDVSSPTEAAWVFLTQWWRISGACTSPECGFTGERGKVLVLQMVWRCLRVSVQMQKGQLPERPPPDLPHLHLRQRGSVGDPALRPLGCQSHPGSPAQRNHPGGRQQRRRWVEKEDFLSQIANKEKEIKHLPAGADEERTEQPEGDRRLPVGLLVWRMACSLLTSHQMIDIILPPQPPQRFFLEHAKVTIIFWVFWFDFVHSVKQTCALKWYWTTRQHFRQKICSVFDARAELRWFIEIKGLKVTHRQTKSACEDSVRDPTITYRNP